MNSDGYLTEDIATSFIHNAYRSTGTSFSEAGNAYNKASSGDINLKSAFSGAGLLPGLKTVGTGFLSNFGPLLLTATLASIGIKAAKGIWDYGFTNNAAKKKYENSSSVYSEAVSDRNNIQSQYDSNKDRIQELRAKQNKTPDETKELANLQNQNKLLDAQLTIKDKVVDSTQKQAALDAKAALEKRTFQGNLLGRSVEQTGFYSDLDYAELLMNGLKQRESEYKDIISDNSIPDSLKQKKLKAKDSKITQYKSELSDLIDSISDTSQDLYDENGDLIDKKNTAQVSKRIQNILDDYADIMGSTDNISDKINNIFALSDYADLQDKLTDLGKKSGSKGLKEALKNDKSYSDLVSALSDKNVSTDDLTDYIMSIADPDAKNIEGIKQNLKDEFAYNKKLNNFFKDKSDKDIEGFWDYYQNQGFDAEEYGWKKKDLSDNWNAYLKTKEKTEEEGTSFSSLFKNATEDTASDIDTVTDNFQTDIGNIKSAMDKLTTGEMKNSDITDLIQQFPELANKTDDLQSGLQKIATGKTSGYSKLQKIEFSRCIVGVIEILASQRGT